MPAFLKRLGLEAFAEDEESYLSFVNHILANGKAITGYYGLPYINYHMGWAQLVGRIGPKVDGKYQFNDLDTHCAGICLWDVRIVSVMNDPENDDPLSKVLVVKGMDGSGLAVVHVVNADVLPSFAEDEAIRLQMIAFPEEISYYSDEEAYVATVEPDKFGKKLTVGENTLFPNGIFAETDKVPVKSITQIHGTVKKLLKGEVKLGEETFYPFIDCIVDTQFGEIEILHTIEDVDEAQRKHLKVGATVNCINHIEILREEVTRVGGGFLSVPGTELPGESEFFHAEETPDEVLKELQMLFDGRYLTSSVSFIGKPYPQALLDEEGESYAVQSAFRLAYSHMSTELDDNNVIQELDYSTWQSTGTGFGDMFMRPVLFSDRKEELVDTLLYMIDRYSDDEWKAFMRNSDEDDQ